MRVLHIPRPLFGHPVFTPFWPWNFCHMAVHSGSSSYQYGLGQKDGMAKTCVGMTMK